MIYIQYMLFLIMHNTVMPPQADDLMHELFIGTIGLKRHIEDWLLKDYFANNPRFEKEAKEEVGLGLI